MEEFVWFEIENSGVARRFIKDSFLAELSDFLLFLSANLYVC